MSNASITVTAIIPPIRGQLSTDGAGAGGAGGVSVSVGAGASGTGEGASSGVGAGGRKTDKIDKGTVLFSLLDSSLSRIWSSSSIIALKM